MGERPDIEELYRIARPKYTDFCHTIENLLRNITDKSLIHVISSRAKDEESFQIKACRKVDGTDAFKYDSPFEQIEDVAGARVICFTVGQVELVCRTISENFQVIDHLDKAKDLALTGQVGYVSKHFIVMLSKDRASLAEYADFAAMKCEIQVRTIFQHAWAEIEHRLQYKKSPDFELRSRFQALAGFIQVADREFESVSLLGRQVAEDVDIGIEAELTDIPDGHLLTNAAYKYGSRPSDLVSMGQYDKAIDTYSSLIELQPNQVWHYVGRAKAYGLSGDSLSFRKDLESISAFKSKEQRVKDSISRLKALKI